MRAGWLLGLAGCLAGCDVVFGTTHPHPDGALDVDATSPPQVNANFAFVSSKRFIPGQLGGLAQANAACQNMATVAGLSGTYRAWLSDSTTNAVQQLDGKRGWVRRDGLPFVDTIQDLVQGRIRYPLRLTETGEDIGRGDEMSVRVLTGTSATGVGNGANCLDDAGMGETVTAGLADAGFPGWTSGANVACGDSVHLYCFGIDRDTQVAATPQTLRRAFVSVSSAAGNATLNALDTVCKTDGQVVPGGPGTFLAAVPVQGMSARGRFGPGGMPWARLDGVTVFDADGTQVAPLEIAADGTRSVVSVWTGAASLTSTFNNQNCGDWATPTLSATGVSGSSARSSAMAFTADTPSCQTVQHVYCLEQ